MKEGIHPDYQQTTIRCACGEVIETGSTKKDITVEICSRSWSTPAAASKSLTRSSAFDDAKKSEPACAGSLF